MHRSICIKFYDICFLWMLYKRSQYTLYRTQLGNLRVPSPLSLRTHGRRHIPISDFQQRRLLAKCVVSPGSCYFFFFDKSGFPLQNTVVPQLRILVDLVKYCQPSLVLVISYYKNNIFPSTRAPAIRKMICYG